MGRRLNLFTASEGKNIFFGGEGGGGGEGMDNFGIGWLFRMFFWDKG